MTALEIRGARSDAEVAEAYDLAARVFGPAYYEARAAKDRILQIEPPADFRDVVVALFGRDVVGLVRLVDRDAELWGQVVKIGGITSVAVRPDHRGSGCGRFLMDAAIERSRNRGDVLSVAFARRAVDGFYWRLGYVGLGAHVRMTCSVPEGEEVPRLQVSRTMLPAAEPILAAAYEHTYSCLPLRFVRPRDWWPTLRTRFPWLGDESIGTVLQSASPIGYYVADEGAVIEAAAIPGRMDAVCDAVLQNARNRTGELVLSLPPSHPLAASIVPLNHTLTVRRAWDGGHVVRAIDRDAMIRILGDRMTDLERSVWRSADLRDHDDARRTLIAAATGSLKTPPVWSRLDEF